MMPPTHGPNAYAEKKIIASDRLRYPRVGVGSFTSMVSTVVSAVMMAISGIKLAWNLPLV